MAGKIKAIIAAQFEDSGLKKAQKGFQGLGKTIKGALGAVGIGLSLASITQSLDAMGRAAAADAKSQALLAQAMKNVTGANTVQIASVEASIQKFSSLYAVLDDQIRPAMSQFVRITGDATKATELTDLALNVAAGTGRDLGSVTIALSKAYQGNTASLARLGINVKGLKDPLGALAKQFEGSAQAAANLDPYQRLNVAMDNTQETIGAALLPAMNRLADYMNSDAFKTGIDAVAGDFADFVSGLILVQDTIDDIVKNVNTALSGLGVGIDLTGFNNFINRLIPGINILSAIMGAGKMANDQAALNAGSGFNTNTLEGIIKASGGRYTPPPVFDDGKSKGASTAQKKATAAAKAAADAIKAATDAANKQAEAYLAAAKAAEELMASTRMMLGEFTQLFKVAPELGAFEQQAVDAFANIFDAIDSALADDKILSGAASALREYAASERRTLQAIAKQRDVLAGKIDVARAITTGVTGLLNITGMLETTSKSVTQTVSTIINGISVATTKTFDVVESGGLIDNFQKLVDKTKAFAKNLVDLKKLGLNKQLFAQLVNAGADAGGATAEAIVAGGADTISALNSLYNELALSAGDIASNATDTLYEVGQQVVSNGFIEGLLSQDSELQRAAQTLADAFASTFQTQLQLAVDAVLPNQSGLIDQVAAVNLSGGGVGGSNFGTMLKSASVGRGTIFNVNVSAGVVTDPNGLARTVIDSVKKYERSNGSVWVAA
jgi:hypothetical protein